MTTHELESIASNIKNKLATDLPPEAQRMLQGLMAAGRTKDQVQIFLEKLMLLSEIMKDDIAHFTFMKTDGTLRSAYGTRKKEIIDAYLAQSGSRKGKVKDRDDTPEVFTYFDIEKLEWRCFRVEKIEHVDMYYTI